MHGCDAAQATSDRFRPDKGFQGADGAAERSGPVQFEKDKEDFGLDDFLSTVKEGAKKRTAEGFVTDFLSNVAHAPHCSNDDGSKRRK